MASEIPLDLINQVQIALRKEANISSYNPNESSLPNLPSLEESLATLDPSPEQLRCKHCKGRLLRGSESVICVFCGREPNEDASREPIKFKNMLAFRWLLDSLDVDGSEIVGPSSDGKDSNRENLTLSDLLDLEIKWPSDDERFGISFSDGTFKQNSGVLNLVGVNHDTLLSDAKQDTLSNAFDGQAVPKKQLENVGSSASPCYGNLSFFENVETSATDVRSEKEEISNSFTGWESNFQSAAKKDVVATSEEEVVSKKDINSTLSNAIESDLDANLFEKKEASQTASKSLEKKFGDTFSGWDANFQSAASGTPRKESESFDAFASSTQKESKSFDLFASSSSHREPELSDTFASSTPQNESESFDPFVVSTPQKEPELSDTHASSTPLNESETFDPFVVSTSQKEPELSNTFASSTPQNEFESFDPFVVSSSQRESELSDTFASSILQNESKSFDPFVVSTPQYETMSSHPFASSTAQKEPESSDSFSGSGLDLSAHMDTVFGHAKGSEHRESKDSTATSSSTHNNWLNDDIWSNFNSAANAQAGDSGITSDVKDDNRVEHEKNSSSLGFDGMEKDRSQTTNSKASYLKTIDVDDDTFDDWSDFTGSTSAQDTSNISQQQTISHMPSAVEQSVEGNLFGSTNNIQTPDLGSFFEPDLFSGGSVNQSNSTAADLMESDASVIDKMNNMRTNEFLGIQEDPSGGGVSHAITASNPDNVESLILQMHDLSFMLDNHLSIPKT